MVRVNGAEHPLLEQTSLLALLKALSFRVDAVVVEQNGQIVTQQLFADTIVSHGDVIEVVQFMGGG